MAMRKKSVRSAKVALEMKLAEKRYCAEAVRSSIDFSVVVTSRWNFDSLTPQQLQEAEDRLLDFATQTSK